MFWRRFWSQNRPRRPKIVSKIVENGGLGRSRASPGAPKSRTWSEEATKRGKLNSRRPLLNQQVAQMGPQELPGEPFGLHFLNIFVDVFRVRFRMPFLLILGCILGPFWIRFCFQNRPRRASGAKRSIFKNIGFT